MNEAINLAGTELDINLEVLNRFESNFINTLEEGTEFLKLIDNKNVRLLADTFHMNIEEPNIVKSIEQYYSSIGYIHVCENHRGVPGTGHIPFKDIIGLLKRKNYEGYLTMECISSCGTEVANGMSIWRDLGQDEFVEAKKGIDYLKQIIEVE
jgi:D-psicose/D-tagatose/L-ribulose 3-epimerase